MPAKFLGKILFPRLPAWQAKRQARHLLAAIAVALAFGCVMVAIIWFQGHRR